ncbi:MAG: DUF4830 domain-containing protein [Oscillospiraceae bacterium]|nr:DUF4830 domain-containing protein [Oscillospiraceae bacterium]
MMVVTKKIKKRDILFAVLIVAAILAVLLIPSHTGDDVSPVMQKVKTNDDRVAFLSSMGREVEQQPVEEQDVRISAENDELLARYNELQQAQGYDLTDYAGKIVKRYVYRVLNDPSGDVDLYATIYIHDGDVIGGDVASRCPGGKMRALKAA